MPTPQVQISLEAIGPIDTDVVHWLEDLDREPERLWCLPHGHELPCGQCERGNILPTLEARS